MRLFHLCIKSRHIWKQLLGILSNSNMLKVYKYELGQRANGKLEVQVMMSMVVEENFPMLMLNRELRMYL